MCEVREWTKVDSLMAREEPCRDAKAFHQPKWVTMQGGFMQLRDVFQHMGNGYPCPLAPTPPHPSLPEMSPGGVVFERGSPSGRDWGGGSRPSRREPQATSQPFYGVGLVVYPGCAVDSGNTFWGGQALPEMTPCPCDYRHCTQPLD